MVWVCYEVDRVRSGCGVYGACKVSVLSVLGGVYVCCHCCAVFMCVVSVGVHVCLCLYMMCVFLCLCKMTRAKRCCWGMCVMCVICAIDR